MTEQEAFEAWCPYKGSPDPRVVWAAAWKAARDISDREIDCRTAHIYYAGKPTTSGYRIGIVRAALQQ